MYCLAASASVSFHWGRRNITRMLEIAAWHEDELCLVAVEDERAVGFASARIDRGSGLLPGLLGQIEALYITPPARTRGLSRRLANATIAALHERGADVVHNLICIDDDDARSFWQAIGFAPDMVCLSLYREG